MSDEEKVPTPRMSHDTNSPADNLPMNLSREAKSTSSEAPNGGLSAWLQVAGAFFLYFNTWWVSKRPKLMMDADLISHTRGVINMYGVFQTFYELNILERQSASNISWVGSLQGSLIFFGGAIVGPFFDLGYLRLLLFLGTFCTVFGMMMTSICQTYWQFMLAQGVTVGIGFGCLFLPSVAIVSQYFTTKKSIAFGIVSTEGSVGTLQESLF